MQKQYIDVVFASGLETRSDSKLVPATKMLDVVNMVQTKTGTLEKRAGRDKLSSLETTDATYVKKCANAYSLHSDGKSLVCIGLWEAWNGSAWVYDRAYGGGPQACVYQSSMAEWRASHSNVEPVSIEVSRIDSGVGQHESQSVSYAGGLIGVLSVEETYTTAIISIIERSTGANILREFPWQVATGAIVKTIGNGNYLEFLWFKSGQDTKWLSIDVTADIPLSPVTSASTKLPRTTSVDMVPYGDYNYFVYLPASGNLVLEKFAPGASTATTTYECDGLGGRPSIAIQRVCCNVAYLNKSGVRGYYLAVGYKDNVDSKLKWAAFNLSTLALEIGPYYIHNYAYAGSTPEQMAVAGCANDGDIIRGWAETYSSPTYTVYSAATDAGVAVSGSSRSYYNERLESAPFTYGGRSYVWTSNVVSGEESFNLRAVGADSDGTDRVAARIMLRDGECGRATSGDLPHCQEVSSGVFLMCLRDIVAISGEGDGLRCRLTLVEVDFTKRHLPSIVVRKQILIGGGVLQLWDGKIADNGINAEPPAPTLAASGSGSMSDGTYSYKLVYEWTDAQGFLHRSPASLPASITLSGGGSSQAVSVSYQLLNVGAYAKTNYLLLLSNARVVYYRTTAGGSTYYRTTDPSVDDTTLEAGDVLYSDSGGEVEVASTSGCACVCKHINRVLVVPFDDRELIQYSHELIDGHGVEFSELLSKRVSGGDINALLSLDDKVVIATSDRLRYMVGDGANRVGVGDSWSDAYPIQCEIGIADQNHVAEIPAGFVFFSKYGFFLLSRDLSTIHLTPPWDYRTKTVRYCLTILHRKQVRWVFTDDTALVWDYEHNCWLRELNAIDQTGCVHDDVLYIGDSSGNLYKENQTKWQDDSSNIDTLIDTGWLNIGGVTGYQRLWEIILLGEWHSAHTVTVKAYYDWSTTAGQTAGIYAAADPTPYLLRFKPTKQRCTAVRLRIETTGATGKAASFTGLRFVVGAAGKTPIPSTRNF